MPVVQRQVLRKGTKTLPELWADVHTKLSGGQVRVIVKLHRKYHLASFDSTEEDPIGWQYATTLLLTEAWNLADPDKPGEVLPKSDEGIEKASADELSLLWGVLQPAVESAFPNPPAGETPATPATTPPTP